MSLPNNHKKVLFFLTRWNGPTHPWLVERERHGTRLFISEWDEVKLGRAQPTEQEVIDAGNDLTVVNGQTFSQWLAEHGDDPVKTKRREARERLDRDDYLARIVVAVVQGILDQVRAEVPGVVDPTPEQIRVFIKNKVDVG